MPKEQKAPEAPAEPLPTVREHCDRAKLPPWAVNTVLAYLHATRKVDANAVLISTRIDEETFKAALQRALYGRV